jgi:uncharacterized membrane protein
MRIGKPLIIGVTVIGVALGLYEGWRFAGGLVVLMVALMSVIGAAMATLIATVRRERREEEAARQRATRDGPAEDSLSSKEPTAKEPRI